ncbi:hypothetical protein ACWY4P_53730 (plasmid) [Streptomyces sp. LZ34]
MTRRRTYTRTCAHPGCPERSFVEYTARRDLEGVSPTWKCYRHNKPNEVLSVDNPETTGVLTLHPSYIDSYRREDPPKLIGYFWGPEGAEEGHSGIVDGPGFKAIAKDFPPGTRLIVTAHIELPDTEDPQDRTKHANELKADWSRYRGHVLQEVWQALRDAEGGPLIDGMKVVNELLEKP